MRNRLLKIVASRFVKPALLNLFYIIPRFKRKFNVDEFGVNYIGFARAELGLANAMRSLVFATEMTGLKFMVRDFNPSIKSRQTNIEMERFLEKKCNLSVNCICINPDILYMLPVWLNYSEWGTRYNVGYWFWELEKFPVEWRYALNIVDEIWVNTEYLAGSMRQTGLPVIKIPFSLSISENEKKLSRKDYGLQDNDFVFLFSFDHFSSEERKNPLDVVKSFLKAFPRSLPESPKLIIKSLNSSGDSKFIEWINIFAKNDPRIIILDKQFNKEEMHGLLRSCDCYVSLHRAEGLGLGMAEAMYLGKPVIATAYSGNMEFMNPENAFLVPYERVPVENGEYPNATEQLWAQPNIDVAAEYMKTVFYDKDQAASIGINAQIYMRNHHSPSITAKEIKERIKYINNSLNKG